MTDVITSAPSEGSTTVQVPESSRAPLGSHPKITGISTTLAAMGASGLAAKAQLSEQAYPCPIILSSPPKEVRIAVAATFGFSQDLLDDIVQTGYDAWLQSQLDPNSLDEWHKFEFDLTDPSGYDYDTIGLIPCSPEADALICPNNGANRNRVRRQIVRARVIRALYSPAQIFERMVDFWTDHLNTWHLTPGVDRMKTFEDHNLRLHALGHLSDLLIASATSPAMLKYLDGNVNIAGNPNENYARELLELHTLGVDVCYDESTIETMARALTGWRVNLSGGSCCGEVTFNNSLHDNSAKTLVFPGCGTYNIPAGSGQNEISLVIDILTDPAKLGRRTAYFIAQKMVGYFISCDPPQGLIREMVSAYVNAYQNSERDIAAMVNVMLSQRWIRCTEFIFKRPMLLMTSALRALGAQVTDPGFDGDNANYSLVGDFLSPAGHVPFNWPAPDGYPSPCETDYWASNLLPRWSLGASIAHDEFDFVDISGVLADMSGLTTAQQVTNFLNQRLFAGYWPFSETSILVNYLNTLPAIDVDAKRQAIGLAIGSPTFAQY